MDQQRSRAGSRVTGRGVGAVRVCARACMRVCVRGGGRGGQNVATLEGGFSLTPDWVSGPYEAQAPPMTHTHAHTRSWPYEAQVPPSRESHAHAHIHARAPSAFPSHHGRLDIAAE